MNYDLATHGFALLARAVAENDVDSLRRAIEASTVHDSGSVRRRKSVYAIRNVLDVVPEARELVESRQLRALVEPVLGVRCFPVRGILFDKVPGANWKVPWHQDLSIAVQERIEVDGFGPWSEKAGVVHVQPPARVLENMLTLRLHLDDCNDTNGPLRVLPASHRDGKLSAQQIAEWRERADEVSCVLPRGGILLTGAASSSRAAHRMGSAPVTRRFAVALLKTICLKHAARTTNPARCRKRGVHSG
jgi:hypothetical protein